MGIGTGLQNMVARWGSNPGEIDDVRIDAATNSIQTVTYAHHEIHSGSHYVTRTYWTIAKNGSKDILIVTPAGTKMPHVTTGFNLSTSTTVVEWFDAVTTSNDGDLLLSRNRNRNFADNNTTLIYEDPTVTDGAVAGNILQEGIFGSGRGSIGGGARDSEEIIFKPSTKYLVRFTEQNISAVDLNFFADWYAHTPKH